MVESPALKRSATPTVPLKLYAGLKKKKEKTIFTKSTGFHIGRTTPTGYPTVKAYIFKTHAPDGVRLPLDAVVLPLLTTVDKHLFRLTIIALEYDGEHSDTSMLPSLER